MKKRKILALFTAFSLAATMFGSFPAYADPPATVTITPGTDEAKTGTGQMTITLTIPLKTAAATDFDYTAPSELAYDGNDKTATVAAKSGVTGMGDITVHYYSDSDCNTEVTATKNLGTYYVGITLAEGTHYAASTTVIHDDSWNFTVTKGTPSAPAAPAMASATKDSITLKAVDDCEYSIDNTNWQDSPVFTELTASTAYTFYQRYKETSNSNPSPSSSASISTTDETGARYAMTITLVIKPKQTITAENVTATYGDTNKSVSASVTDPATGGGAISYSVKTGSEDYIDVNASTGALTIKKAGTATVIVTAAATDEYAETTKEVTVTISKADNPATVTGTATVAKGGSTVDLSANVTKNGATGDVTYAISGSDLGCSLSGSVLTSGENAGEVTVNVTVAEDDNYNALAATSITVTISDHTHTMTHYSASSGDCRTRGHIEYWYCSGCQKYFNDAEGASEIESSSIYTGYGSHSYSSKITTEPTCTETGVRTYTCSICGDKYTSTVSALNHKYDPDTHICERCNELDPDAFPAYKTAQKKAADALSETTDSEASKKLITDAKTAIDAVTYVETKTFAENAAVIDTIIAKLKTDLTAQRAKDKAHSDFEKYKTEQEAAVDKLARDTDSEASKKLIADAKAAIDAVEYDDTKTFAENAAVIDAIIEQLKTDLDAQRKKDNAPGEFAKYKAEQKAAADALAETTDSEASKKLITDAKAAIDALTYDETKTYEENTALVDAIIEQLKADLEAQRAKDNAAAEFEKYKTEQKAAADALGRDTDSEASKKLITDAKAAIDALTYDEEKTLDDNKALVDAIIEQLKSDLAAQRIKDDAEGEFARYKTERKEYVSSLAETGDSDKCKELITKAKADIDAITYDNTKTFEQNKARVDAIVNKLISDLAKQRNDDNYETYKNEFEAYKTNRKAYADTLAKDTTNVNEKSIIDKAKSAIAALTYDKNKSLAENKARVDAIIEQLRKDIDAYWATVVLTVKFDSYGGTEVEPVTVSYGKTVSAPTVEKTGYNFVNWTLDGAAYDFTQPVTSNITLTANWEAIKYNVTFFVNNEKHSEAVVEHGKRVVFPEITVSAGQELFGWALDKELTIGFTAITPVTKNLILYAEERPAAKVLIDGEKTDSLDTALASLTGKDDFINLYEDQELKNLKFPKGDTAIVVSGNGNALEFNGSASLAPKQELTLDDLTITAANKKGKAQNITLTAAAGGLSLSDVTLDGKNANIKGTKGNITLGDIDSSKCVQLNVTGSKKTALDIEGDVDATKVTGFGTLNVNGTLTIDKTLNVNELYLADGAVLNITSGATVTIKNGISGTGTIHLANGFKPITINGKASGHITITADGTLENQLIIKSKLTNLNDVFDISAIVPAITDGEYEYGLYTKSGKVYLYAYKFAINGTTYAVWADAMKAITNLKAKNATYTFELLGDTDLGSSFTLPAKDKYAGLTIYGNGHTITFTSSSITLTADLTLRDITLNATAKKGCAIKLNKFKLDIDESVKLTNCTQK